MLQHFLYNFFFKILCNLYAVININDKYSFRLWNTNLHGLMMAIIISVV